MMNELEDVTTLMFPRYTIHILFDLHIYTMKQDWCFIWKWTFWRSGHMTMVDQLNGLRTIWMKMNLFKVWSHDDGGPTPGDGLGDELLAGEKRVIVLKYWNMKFENIEIQNTKFRIQIQQQTNSWLEEREWFSTSYQKCKMKTSNIDKMVLNKTNCSSIQGMSN